MRGSLLRRQSCGMEITQQYIACDLADNETLADYRKRCGKSRRRRLFR